ncbi:MarR family winged helix-turn-helix transcriptional regulator [Photorhabdus namnaonensis]|uniref:MarR family protein n=1 Tax=Photorhabdus namnaonensis TaxID=1851568 RepID=A0A1B8YES2_9GAMM|nr:MarR family winged helix-turn-helix transcriptional regulator [Photorhabdus namnaonensis]OCA53664.1 MarR family protein [Photorhabdus namnaonensis]
MSTEETSAFEVFTEITLAVFRLNALLLSKGDQLVAPLGITSARWQVLGAIAHAPHPPTAPQIAAAMGITRQGVQKQLNLGLSSGMVRTLTNPRHERSPLYQLTELGWRTFDAAISLEAKWVGSLMQSSDPNKLKVTLNILISLETKLGESPVPNGTTDSVVNNDKELPNS